MYRNTVETDVANNDVQSGGRGNGELSGG